MSSGERSFEDHIGDPGLWRTLVARPTRGALLFEPTTLVSEDPEIPCPGPPTQHLTSKTRIPGSGPIFAVGYRSWWVRDALEVSSLLSREGEERYLD